ncbi:MAG: hypothetical protein AAF170_08710 [Bacteroidota bacterium]
MPSSPIAPVLTYNLKLWLASLTAALFIPLSVVALVLDLVTRRSLSDGLSGRVLRASAQMEAAIDVHGDLTDIQVRDDASFATA